MAQHIVLLVVAAPLLAAGVRVRASSRPLRAWPAFAAAGVHASIMVGWHLPAPFDVAEAVPVLHAVEHATLLASAALFWRAVGVGAPYSHRAAVGAVFIASLAGTALGAAMTLASRPWYEEYPSLSDQQMAGVLMWSFAGLAYVGIGVMTLLRSLVGESTADEQPVLAPAGRAA